MLKDDPSAAAPARPANHRPPWTRKALRLEWLGQMLASLCWILSVFAYGLGTLGDALQLAAASSWLVANLAALASSKSEG